MKQITFNVGDKVATAIADIIICNGGIRLCFDQSKSEQIINFCIMYPGFEYDLYSGDPSFVVLHCCITHIKDVSSDTTSLDVQ